ncbi:uncharacterized protein [Typha angustifolia]|uniref:uncharacterized protein n=1 Tax=Typha angustifolia TaxID=59011 RepID=UPI003C2F4B6E
MTKRCIPELREHSSDPVRFLYSTHRQLDLSPLPPKPDPITNAAMSTTTTTTTVVTTFLVHAAVSVASFRLGRLLHLPSLFLHGLHTYLHPDSLPPDATRALLRPPSSSSSPSPSSDLSSSAHLLRLSLSHSHLSTRVHFSSYNSSFLSSLASVSSLLLSLLLPSSSSPFFSSLLAFLSIAHLLLLSSRLSLFAFATHASRSFLSSLLLSPLSFILLPNHHHIPTFLLSVLLSFLLFLPASRFARAFWIGTDQPRLTYLSVVSCSSPNRLLLYVSLLLSAASSFLFLNPGLDDDLKILSLAASAFSLLIALRPCLQMYLNEAVLCWYQQLHGSRVPDLDYGQATVFLHNHCICVVATQLFAPPVLTLLFLAVSQLRGNLFTGLVVLDSLADCSDGIKEIALFMAWWVMFVWSVVTLSKLAFNRRGWLYVS